MEKIKTEHCPKCHAEFLCNSDDITNCQCFDVDLSAETFRFMSKTSFNCLCRSCLARTNQIVNAASGYTFPIPAGSLIDGVHFYTEHGNWVFTELYHVVRGHCCRNGCRHCPYGFVKTRLD